MNNLINIEEIKNSIISTINKKNEMIEAITNKYSVVTESFLGVDENDILNQVPQNVDTIELEVVLKKLNHLYSAEKLAISFNEEIESYNHTNGRQFVD